MALTVGVGCLLCMEPGAVSALDQPLPGGWSLSAGEDQLSLWTDAAPLGDVLQGIQDVTAAHLRFGPVPETNITVRFRNQSLDQLLSHLRVSFFLTYRAAVDGQADEMEDAWVGVYSAKKAAPAAFAFQPPDSDSTGAGSPSLSQQDRQRLQQAVAQHRQNGDGESTLYPVAAPVSMRLDGSTGDWPDGVPWEFVSVGGAGAEDEASADSSFELAAVASSNDLFFAVRIRDDARAVSELAFLNHGEDDAFELFLQPIDDAGGDLGRPISMTVNRHHVLRRGPEGSRHAPPTQYVGNSQGMKAVVVDGDDGWSIEMAIPLDRISGWNHATDAMRFNVRLHDRDIQDESPATLVWGRTDRLSGLAGNWGTDSPGRLQLVPIGGHR